MLDGEYLSRGRVKTTLHALAANDNPAHVDAVLGSVCISAKIKRN